ncbi:MAG: hypothetical protein LUE29_01340 [Lachnospiraceae bacterium]|nr:hypothetical protein [Lachnospiraceae bacterium]
MSFKDSIRDICRKIGIGRLLLIGAAGVVLILCSLDFGSIFSDNTENQTNQSGEADAAGQSSGTDSSGSGGTGGTGGTSGTAGTAGVDGTSVSESALTDIYDAAAEESLSMQELEARLEERLAGLLSQIAGVGETEVMIVLSSGVGKDILKDETSSKDEVTEADSAGGSRQSVSFDQSEDTVMDSAEGSSAQTPYVLKYLAPEITGVAVVAEGGSDAGIVAEITELVAALFGIDVTQISVAGMN